MVSRRDVGFSANVVFGLNERELIIVGFCKVIVLGSLSHRCSGQSTLIPKVMRNKMRKKRF